MYQDQDQIEYKNWDGVPDQADPEITDPDQENIATCLSGLAGKSPPLSMDVA